MKVVCHCPTHKRYRQKKNEEKREGAEEKEVEEGEASIETDSNVCGSPLSKTQRDKRRKQRFSKKVQNGSTSVLIDREAFPLMRKNRARVS